jgi:hypothetical protein
MVLSRDHNERVADGRYYYMGSRYLGSYILILVVAVLPRTYQILLLGNLCRSPKRTLEAGAKFRILNHHL